MQLISNSQIEKMVTTLRAGGVLVYPTETSYGMGCDAANQAAVDRIFTIKGRREDKPLLVVVSDVTMAKKYMVGNELLDVIAEKYWPGAVTVVGEYQSEHNRLANGVVGKDNTIAIRVTSAPLAQQLCTAFGGPIVATSANIAGEPNIYDAIEAVRVFSEREYQPDIVVDGGVLPERASSTLVSVVGGTLHVLRQGEIKVIC